MALKHHTVIFVPHARAKLRKWRVTNLQLAITAGAIVLVTVLAGFITWSYFNTHIDREQLDQLRARNESLREATEFLQHNVDQLRGKLSEYEDRTQKLAILAGLESLNSGPEAGIGGVPGAPSSLDPREELEILGLRADALTDSLDQVAEKLGEQVRMASAMPSITPTRGLFSSGYGFRKDPVHGRRAFHQGIDISAAPGAPVHASADGVVTLARRNGGLGRSVYIAHGFGYNTRYGHLSRIGVSEGDRVKRGDVIGHVGNTGRSTGYHLHYEVRVDGKPANPIGYILDTGLRN